MGTAAVATPGDLDPAFGDVGRVSDFGVPGTLWSIDMLDDESMLFGGGDDYCYYTCDPTELTGRLLGNGTPDAAFAAAALEKTMVYDSAVQADGKLVAVGFQHQPDGRDKLAVFRLQPEGALDPSFGTGGVVVLSDGTGSTEMGFSVLIDPDGSVVVAGRRANQIVVARLSDAGALDTSFGSEGYYVAPSAVPGPTRIARAPGGAYRLMLNLATPTGAACSVIGLTSAGTVDTAFGDQGIAATEAPPTGSRRPSCVAMAGYGDGRVVVGGSRDGAPHLARLSAGGAVDTGFASEALDGLTSVTAVALSPTGAIFVAGGDTTGLSGAAIVRLLADGTLDRSYGVAGKSGLELNQYRFTPLAVRDIQVRAQDAIVVSGGSLYYSPTPFVARLLGNGQGSGPGVLSLQKTTAFATEQGGAATVTVRRVGGRRGAVAVSYGARSMDAASARAGEDFEATSGRLTWADGDTSDKQIVVPVYADSAVEEPEFFDVVLDAPEGGAGLGVFGAAVEIAGSSYPAGTFRIVGVSESVVAEGKSFSVLVSRESYSVGAVSVTLHLSGGTAQPGEDFASPGSTTAWSDVVVTWGDGQGGVQEVKVPTLTDKTMESSETIEFTLASPTGGALIASNVGPTTVTITNAAAPPSGGGGVFGALGALFAGALAFARRGRGRPPGG